MEERQRERNQPGPPSTAARVGWEHHTYLLGPLLLEVLDLPAKDMGPDLALLEGSMLLLVVVHGLFCWRQRRLGEGSGEPCPAQLH